MTRINLVPPRELCDQHLIAEWRELTRIPNGILQKRYVVDLSRIPTKYTIRTEQNPSGGTGHVTFFFDKLQYLHKRYTNLLAEGSCRGLNLIDRWPDHSFDTTLWNDYTPPTEAIELNKQRIMERTPKKPRHTNHHTK